MCPVPHAVGDCLFAPRIRTWMYVMNSASRPWLSTCSVSSTDPPASTDMRSFLDREKRTEWQTAHACERGERDAKGGSAGGDGSAYKETRGVAGRRRLQGCEQEASPHHLSNSACSASSCAFLTASSSSFS